MENYEHRYTVIEFFVMNRNLFILLIFVQKTQRGWIAGFSLYISNTELSTISDKENSTLCYKDGPQLPPLNFTTTCTGHGRYVIFYNERIDGVTYPTGYKLHNVYTELCEVIVLGISQIGKIILYILLLLMFFTDYCKSKQVLSEVIKMFNKEPC